MKKALPILIILAILLILALLLFSSYNNLATSREAVNTQAANIDNQLQRRADLIPNLVESVKGFAQQEKSIMTTIAEARSRLMGAQTMPEKAAANNELSGALSRLLLVVENYPTLKSDATFISLMDELAGTENRISVARDDYNHTVQAYNNKIITFPAKLIAGLFGFDKAEYFQAVEGTEQAPQVQFP